MTRFYAFFLLISLHINIFGQVEQEYAHNFTYNNKDYQIVLFKQRWADAALTAFTHGGYLVEINNAAEQEAIWDEIIASGIDLHYNDYGPAGDVSYIWIGATDQRIEGKWLWDGDGNNVGTHFGDFFNHNYTLVDGFYENWGRDENGLQWEPDDAGDQDYAAIGLNGWPSFDPGALGQQGQWNDIGELGNFYSIIEYDTKVFTNTSELNQPEVLKVFPNPCQNQVTFNVSDNYISGDYSIYNLLGNKVANGIINDNSKTLNINLASGLYFLVIKNQDKELKTKIKVVN